MSCALLLEATPRVSGLAQPINELRPLVAASYEATPPPVTLSISTHKGHSTDFEKESRTGAGRRGRLARPGNNEGHGSTPRPSLARPAGNKGAFEFSLPTRPREKGKPAWEGGLDGFVPNDGTNQTVAPSGADQGTTRALSPASSPRAARWYAHRPASPAWGARSSSQRGRRHHRRRAG